MQKKPRLYQVKATIGTPDYQKNPKTLREIKAAILSLWGPQAQYISNGMIRVSAKFNSNIWITCKDSRQAHRVMRVIMPKSKAGKKTVSTHKSTVWTPKPAPTAKKYLGHMPPVERVKKPGKGIESQLDTVQTFIQKKFTEDK